MADDIVFDLGGLVLYQGAVTPDADGVEWIVLSSEGWFSPVGVRTGETDRPGRDGSYVETPTSASRVVTISGYAVGPDTDTTERARDRFTAHLRGGDPVALTVTEPRLSRFATVTLAAANAEPVRLTEFDWQITVTAADPLKYVQPQVLSTGPATSAGGGIAWNGGVGSTGVQWNGTPGVASPTGLLYQTSSGDRGVLAVVNEGTAAASLVLTWTVTTGTLSMPTARLSSGEAIVYADTLIAGDALTVDTATGAVLLNGANRRPQLSRADFFVLPPGQTEVVFEGTATGASSLSVQWSDAYY